jgi:hypothetical protein
MTDVGTFLARLLRAAASALERRGAEPAAFDDTFRPHTPERNAFQRHASEQDALEPDGFERDAIERAFERTMAGLRRRYPDAPEHWLRFVAERTPAAARAAEAGAASSPAPAPAPAAVEIVSPTTTPTPLAAAAPVTAAAARDAAAQRGIGAAGRHERSSRQAISRDVAVRPRFRPSAPPEQDPATRDDPSLDARETLPRAERHVENILNSHSQNSPDSAGLSRGKQLPRVLRRFGSPADPTFRAPNTAFAAGTSRDDANREVPANGMHAECAAVRRTPSELSDRAAPSTMTIERHARGVSPMASIEARRFATRDAAPAARGTAARPEEELAPAASANHATGGTPKRSRQIGTAAVDTETTAAGTVRFRRSAAASAALGTAAAVTGDAAGTRARIPDPATADAETAGATMTGSAMAVAATAGAVSKGAARVRFPRTSGVGFTTNERSAADGADSVAEPKWPDLPPGSSLALPSSSYGPRQYVAHFADFAEPPRTEGPDRWNALPF